jgi:hypothetical protein
MPRGSSIEDAREMVSEIDKKGEGRVDYAEVRLTLPCLLSLTPLNSHAPNSSLPVTSYCTDCALACF